MNTRTDAPIGSTEALCNIGVNTLPTVGAPVALSVVLNKGMARPVRTLCSYPTTLASATLGCDATVPDVPYSRFCPCIDYNCDAPPPEWYVGESGDSCTATCDRVGAVCDSGPLKNIVTPTAFSALLETTFNVPVEQYCNGGVNIAPFADAAAVTTVYTRASNVTFCNYPTANAAFHGECNVAFPASTSSRFCSCRPVTPARRALTEVTAIALPATSTSNVIVARKLRGGVV